MNVTIDKTIGLGDAGTPFNVAIYVEYEENGDQIKITSCEVDNCPYDNPPESWFGQIKDAVEDYFYDRDSNNKVVWL